LSDLDRMGVNIVVFLLFHVEAAANVILCDDGLVV
jgi:hypothetical protein